MIILQTDRNDSYFTISETFYQLQKTEEECLF